MSETPKLKDYFDQQLVEQFGARVARAHPGFDQSRFLDHTFTAELRSFEDLTFTERSQRIAEALHDTLDLDAPAALTVIKTLLPDELDDPEGALNNGFWMWPLGAFIATYGADDYEPAMDACYELTKRFTAEFAIRPLLERYPESLDRLESWADDPNEHVRRLVSEGTRSRLPWATRLQLPIERVLDLLARLRSDESAYVRRSVANHLNDLAKDDSERVVDLLENWHAENVEETTWIVRHALRNHLKAGDPRVLRLFGYDTPEVEVIGPAVHPAAVMLDETVEIGFEIANEQGYDQKLMIDLVVGYMKANGETGPKVFKFRDTTLPAGERRSYTRSLEMVQRSTRVLHRGQHTVCVRVNGVDSEVATFEFLFEATGPAQNRP